MLAVALWLIVLTDIANVWSVYAIAFGLGLVTVVDHPAHNAFVEEIVGPEQMPNAVALNSAVLNSARITGPAIAAVLIAQFGVAWVFFGNAVSFIAVVGSLLMMRRCRVVAVPPLRRTTACEGRPALRVGDPRDAAHHLLARRRRHARVELPHLHDAARRSTPSTAAPGLAGLLMAVLGVGTVIGALTAAHRGRTSARMVLLSGIALGVVDAAHRDGAQRTARGRHARADGRAGRLLRRGGQLAHAALSLPSFRGRVMSMYSLLALGSTVLGGPLVGWISQRWNPRVGIGFAGLATVATALVLVALSGRREAAADLTGDLGIRTGGREVEEYPGAV